MPNLLVWGKAPTILQQVRARAGQYGMPLGYDMDPQWARVGTKGHNPMAQWPQLAHWSYSMQCLGAIGCSTGGPGLGPEVPKVTPPPVAKCSELWGSVLALSGHATLMGMAQDCAPGMCSVPLHDLACGCC